MNSRARPGSRAVLASYVLLVATSHMLWISFASVTADAARTFHTTESCHRSAHLGRSALLRGLVHPGRGAAGPVRLPHAAALGRRRDRRVRVPPPARTGPSAPPPADDRSAGPQPFLINAVADLVNRHFPEEEAATATGIGTMSIFLGITVGLVATPPLVSAVGVRGSQVVYAGLALVALAIFWLVAPKQVPARLATSIELTVRQAIARVLHSSTLWKMSAALFLGFGLYLGITTWLEELLKAEGDRHDRGRARRRHDHDGRDRRVDRPGRGERPDPPSQALPRPGRAGGRSVRVAHGPPRLDARPDRHGVRARVLPARGAAGVDRDRVRGARSGAAGGEHRGRRDARWQATSAVPRWSPSSAC